ncbi:MAG: serine/threonine-protein kinase [Kofleriaceae bacterium]
MLSEPRAHQRLGRYELISELGRGGMAELYLARLGGAGGFSKLVAIKRILPQLSSDPRFVEMFLNEGRIAARLSHPNLCQVFELGEDAHQLYLVMEYLEGAAWDALIPVIPRAGGAALPVAVAVIGQICDGLQYAHDSRVVHRDVSPQNLFVTIDGACKVLDFGVSKLKTDERMTRSGIVKGKLSYMPPEQIRGEDVDARADVFAIGVVLWETLTGKRLFARSTDFLVWRAIMEEAIPPVSAFEPAYGPALDAVVARALARDRADRYGSIRELAEDLRRIARPCTAMELAALVRRLCAPHEVSVVDARDTLLDREVTPVPRRRAVWPWFVGVLGALAVAAVIAIVVATLVRSHLEAGVALPLPPPPPPPVVVVAPPPLPPPAPAPVEPAPPPPAPDVRPSRAKPGYYSVDSQPYATIAIDNVRRDQTPVFRLPLAPGRHSVRATLADGRHRTFAITVVSGRELVGTLAW